MRSSADQVIIHINAKHSA